MAGIFINYRSDDSGMAADLINHTLIDRFGRDQVFLDSQSIPVGADFAEELLRRLRTCSVLLVVMGPRWLTLTNETGGRRIDDPADWVRREIAEALALGLRVIPVLLDGATRPNKTGLPDDIAGLSKRQSVPIRRKHTDVDLADLVERIARVEPDLARPLAQLKDMLSRNSPRTAVDRLVRTAADRAVSGFVNIDPLADLPDDAIPAVVTKWLTKCEVTFAELVEMVAAGVDHGDPAQDDVWVTTLDRVLGAVPEPYPALLVSYAIGVAAMARRRDELVHAALNGTEQPALRALKLYLVVDPQYLRTPLSVRLRQVLRPMFGDLAVARQYERAFEEYEYLRTLLELHDSMSASPLGEFAHHLVRGKSNVDERMRRRLAAGSPLLSTGAFDGDPANVATARRRLDAAIRVRYS